MRFEQLITKVRQAEHALEAQERRVATELGQLKQIWRAAWTPGRIIVAGLAAGFVIGRAEPLRSLGRSGNLVQLVSMLAGLFAGTGAQAAAAGAEEAAARAEQAVDPDHDAVDAETLARAEARRQAARAAAEPVDP